MSSLSLCPHTFKLSPHCHVERSPKPFCMERHTSLPTLPKHAAYAASQCKILKSDQQRQEHPAQYCPQAHQELGGQGSHCSTLARGRGRRGWHWPDGAVNGDDRTLRAQQARRSIVEDGKRPSTGAGAWGTKSRHIVTHEITPHQASSILEPPRPPN